LDGSKSPIETARSMNYFLLRYWDSLLNTGEKVPGFRANVRCGGVAGWCCDFRCTLRPSMIIKVTIFISEITKMNINGFFFRNGIAM